MGVSSKKNILLAVALIAIAAFGLFVSCSPDVGTQNGGTAKVGFSVNQAKSLTVNDPTLPSISSDTLLWEYQASKSSGSDTTFSTGAATEWTLIPDDGGSGNPAGTITNYVKFSQGNWDFKLRAVLKTSVSATTPSRSTETAVYYGTASAVSIVDTVDVNTVSINVSGSIPETNGIIKLSGVYILKQDETTMVEPTAVIIDKDTTYAKILQKKDDTHTTDYDYTVTDNKITTADGHYSIAAGSHTVTVQYVGADAYTYASETVDAYVYSNQTTEITGNVAESGAMVNFVPATSGSQEKNVSKTESAIFTVSNVTPSMTAGKDTTVEFPAGALTNSDTEVASTLTVEATATVTANSDSNFNIKTTTGSTTTTEASVGALELTVKVTKDGTTTEVTEFKDSSSGNAVPVTITTYIAKNMTNVKLVYGTGDTQQTWNATASAATAVSAPVVDDSNKQTTAGVAYYESSSGKLVYKTTHFSTFLLDADQNVYDSTNNMMYTLKADGNGVYGIYSNDSLVPYAENSLDSSLYLLDCSLSNNVPDDWAEEKTWTVIHHSFQETYDSESSVAIGGYLHKEDKTNFTSGYGTKIEPYMIASKDQFQNITTNYGTGYGYYKISKDGENNRTIDCSSWTPVRLFGSLNGNGAKLEGIDQKLFYYVGKMPASKEETQVLANWDTRDITLKNFEANFNLEADLDMAAGMIYQINGNNNTTTFDNVTISGKMTGGSNSGAFFTYTGPNQYDTPVTGITQKIVLKNCSVSADLTCTAASFGVIAGYPTYCNQGISISCDKTIDNLFTGNGLTSTGNVKLFSIQYDMVYNGTTYTGQNSIPASISTKTCTTLTSSNPSKVTETGYTATWASNATRMEVYIAAQLDETEGSTDTKTKVVGITMALKHMSTKTKTESATSETVLAQVNSIELLNNQSAYDATLGEDGKLTCKTGGTANFTCGKIKLQVAQYDASSNMVACGSLVIAERSKPSESWTIK